MSATLDKGMPITFSICSETAIASLEAISKEKPSPFNGFPTIEEARKAMAIVREELAKATKRIVKRYPDAEKYRLKHGLAIEILTAIFIDHFEEGTSPISSVDYILAIMDEVWAEIKKGE